MVIRNANLKDAPAIRSLLEQLDYPSDIPTVEQKIKLFSSRGYNVIVYEVENKVVGFASLHVFDMFHSSAKMGRITALCVDESLRDRGVGGALLKAAEMYFSKNNCNQVEVTTNVRRLLTPSFYLKHGYKEDSRRFTKPI